jgi:signal transduction histidine kinase
MTSQRRARADFGSWLLEIPVEQIIASARLVLAVAALAAIYIDPTQPARHPHQVYLILLGYVAFATVLLFVTSARRTSPPLLVASYLIDLATMAALMRFMDGPTSPFFVFFSFILLSSALRWDWRGALATAVALFVLLLLLALGDNQPDTDKDLDRLILRAAYLIVAGVMIAYFGAFRMRSRARFVKLAASPGIERSPDGKLSLDALLAHAADTLRAPRMLLVWEYAEEPERHSWLWDNGHSKYTISPVHAPITTLVAPRLQHAAFVAKDGHCLTFSAHWGLRNSSQCVIASYLREKFAIGATAIAPLCSANCPGYLFALDCHGGDDLLPLITIFADRIGTELEHDRLRLQMQVAAAEQERSRLARDVHDGVLQALTAVALNLKACAQKVDQKTQEELDAMRSIMADEQKRLRALVKDTRAKPTKQNITLAKDFNQLITELRSYWRCEIPLEVKPKDAEISAGCAGQLSLIFAEAVANATKHGHASRVAINLERSLEALDVCIHDNGTGFPGLAGTYGVGALNALKAGPRSICERVTELGGCITLSTSSTGSQLNFQLPLR